MTQTGLRTDALGIFTGLLGLVTLGLGHVAPGAAQQTAAPATTPGSSVPVEGCLAGEISEGQIDASNGYAETNGVRFGAPVAAVWACEWNIAMPRTAKAFPEAQEGHHYVVHHHGEFRVPAAGTYAFHALGDDAYLEIDGKAVQWNTVELAAGVHVIRFEYPYTGGRSLTMQLMVTPPGGTQTLFRVAPGSPYHAPQRFPHSGATVLPSGWEALARLESTPATPRTPASDMIQTSVPVVLEPTQKDLDPTSPAIPVLFAIAKVLNDHPEIIRVEIQANGDVTRDETTEYNLPEQRGRNIRSRLITAGVSPHRLVARGDDGTSVALNGRGNTPNTSVQFIALIPRRLAPDAPVVVGAMPHGVSMGTSRLSIGRSHVPISIPGGVVELPTAEVVRRFGGRERSALGFSLIQDNKLLKAIRKADPSFQPANVATSGDSILAKLRDGREFLIIHGCTSRECGGTRHVIVYEPATKRLVLVKEDGGLIVMGDTDPVLRHMLVYYAVYILECAHSASCPGVSAPTAAPTP